MLKVTPLILAGGSGTRLWPLSQSDKPKQYHKIINNESLLSQTTNRCDDNLFSKSILCTNLKHRPFIEELDTNEYSKIIYEDGGKNTAASILMTCLLNENTDSYMLVFPADHYIPNKKYFVSRIKNALKYIDNFSVITFGIKPKFPSTQYGYIQSIDDSDVSLVATFHEKPNQIDAKKMIAEGNYSWNSGMFLFRVSNLLDSVRAINSSLLTDLTHIAKSIKTPDSEVIISSNEWSQIENVPFDIAVMEKINNIGCCRFDEDWTDLGDWNSIADNSSSDLLIDSNNSFIKSYSPNHDILGIGLENIICVTANKKTLCINKNKSGDIKDILNTYEFLSNNDYSRVYRPWGWYESILKFPNYQVKLLHVNPKGKLSLQSHKRRSEHWVVVEGVAKVQRNDKVLTLSRNESVYLDKEDKHRLWNEEKDCGLKVIEVQVGDYLEEDDIIRYDDIYNRI